MLCGTYSREISPETAGNNGRFVVTYLQIPTRSLPAPDPARDRTEGAPLGRVVEGLEFEVLIHPAQSIEYHLVGEPGVLGPLLLVGRFPVESFVLGFP